MPAHLINGFVFTHASTDVQVTDGFARFITKAECMTIGDKKKCDQALKANEVLARGVWRCQYCLHKNYESIEPDSCGNCKEPRPNMANQDQQEQSQ